MRKISLLSLLMLVFWTVGNAQNLQVPSNRVVNLKSIPKRAPSASRSTISNSIVMDYDSMQNWYINSTPTATDSFKGFRWDVNKNFLTTTDFTLKYYAVNFNQWANRDNNFAVTPTAGNQIRLDSFDIVLGHQNLSGLDDTLIISVYDRSAASVSGTGASSVLNTTPLWADTIIDSQNFFPDVPDNGGFYFLTFAPNVTLPVGKTYGIRVDFKGDTLDYLSTIASWQESCFSQDFSDSSRVFNSGYYINLGTAAPSLTGVRDFNSRLVLNAPSACKYLWLQNFMMTSYSTVISNCGTVSATPVSATCGQSNGSISAAITGNAVGGTDTWQWSSGETTQNVSNKAPGTYSVIRINSNGCRDTVNNIIVGNTSSGTIAATATGLGTSCGQPNGSAAVTSPTGTGVTYSWSTGATTVGVTGLAAGTYSVTVNSGGCTGTASYTVASSTSGSVTISSTTPTNCGASTGSASTSVSGGTATGYAWSNGQSAATLSNVAAGSYTVTVTFTGGCSATAVATISNNGGPTATATGTSPACFGAATGTASVSATGGTAPLTYLWSNSQSTPSITNLVAGTYTVSVSDAGGCLAVQSVTLTNPSQITTLPSTTNVTCNGGSNGAVSVSASGGTGTLLYAWSTGPNTPSLSSLSAGSYTVTVTDAVGCSVVNNFTVTQPSAISANATAQNPSCFNANNGSATVNASGGTGLLSYAWSNMGTTSTISNLGGGSFTVTVTDQNSCTTTALATVTNPSAITANASSTNVQCNGATTGSATVTATGGTGTLSYAWSNGSNTASISGLAANNYTVTVRDVNSCSSTATVSVSQPAAPLISAVALSGTSATASATGGTPGYTYTWSNGSSGNLVTGLTPGATYTLTATDANGCSSTKTFTVPLGIGAINPNVTSFTVYPNPSNGAFNLNIELAKAEEINITVADVTGKIVYSSIETSTNKLNKQLDLTNIPSGSYILSAKSSSGKTITKLVIQ